MRIAIANNMVPYLYGGAEVLADSLCQKLEEYGHQAIVLKFPFQWNPKESILDSIMAVKLNELYNVDMLIGLKFPAYYIDHPNKRFWLVHQFRQAYDLHDTEYGIFNKEIPSDMAIRKAIIDMDNHSFGNAEKKIYTISNVVTQRLKKYNNIDSEVLYPPLANADLYTAGTEFGDYVFYPSRVNASKRQELAIEAMKYTKTNVKLIIAGKGDCKADETRLFEMIERLELKDKVTYLNRFISEQEKIELFRGSLAGVYIPYNEDYGYVTLEGYHAGKPMVTCRDSGEVSTLVKNDITGRIAEPAAESLAKELDDLFNHKQKAKEMGRNGLPFLEELGITWDRVVGRLTE